MRPIDDLHGQRGHWINGQFSPSRAAEDIAVVNPASEQIVGYVAAGDASDVERAVQAASRAFPSWRETALDERLALLTRLCGILHDGRHELAAIITAEVGAPVAIAGPMHVGRPCSPFRTADGISRYLDMTKDVPDKMTSNSPRTPEIALTVASSQLSR